MIRIEIGKNKWEEIKTRHSEWWINWIKGLNFEDYFNELNSEEEKLLLFILNNFKNDDLEKLKENLINKEAENSLNLKKMIINENLKFSMEKSLKGWNKLVNEISNEFDEEYIKFIKEKLLKKSNVDTINKIKWKSQLIKAKTQEQKEYLFYLLLHRALTSEEKNKINALTEAKEIKEFLNSSGLNKEFIESEEKESLELISKLTEYEDISKVFLGTKLLRIVKSIFSYNDFSNIEPPKWGRRMLVSILGIEVCPYCQRAYITNFEDEKKENTTSDLDHFYPKGQYPYLALSLYNFVPSCKFCNSTGRKGAIDTYKEPHIYPYTDSMEEDIKFSVETDSFIDNVFTENQNLNIDINVNIVSKEGKEDIKRPEKIEKSIETFKLREVYKNSHSKYVGDLIHNFQKYPKSYTKALGEIFLEDKDKDSKEHQEKLQILNDNFQEIIKKPYIDKIEKGEPLAKLTKDIMEELGIK